MGKPIIDSIGNNKVKESYDTIKITNDSNYIRHRINTNLTIYTSLYLTNESNYDFTFIDAISIDTISNQPFIRNVLLDGNRNSEIFSTHSNVFFKRGIRQNDTLKIPFVNQVGIFKDDEFHLHYILLWKGENNLLYDTYFWVVYKYEHNTITKTDDYTLKNDSLYINKSARVIIKAVDHIYAPPYAYTKEESEMIINGLSK